MKSTHLISIFLLASFLITGCATMTKTRIQLKDGTQKVGMGRLDIFGGETVKFKEDGTDQTVIYRFDDISSASIYRDGDVNKYVKINVKGSVFSEIVIEVISGAVNLYKKEVQRTSGGMPMGPSFGGAPRMSMRYTYTIEHYYLKKNNETEATHLGSTDLFTKNFKKAASEYFADCPSLVELISEKTYTKSDIELIVNYYNTKCF